MVTIEKLNLRDINKCLKIYNYYIKNTCYTLEEKELSFFNFNKRVKKISKKYPFLVAKKQNKSSGKSTVIGFAYLNFFNPRSAYRNTANLSIYVDNNFLREHTGSLLLNKIEQMCTDYNITAIVSLIASENKNSINFHLKNGFIKEGELTNVAYKFNRSLNLSFYIKHLE